MVLCMLGDHVYWLTYITICTQLFFIMLPVYPVESLYYMFGHESISPSLIHWDIFLARLDFHVYSYDGALTYRCLGDVDYWR